MSPRDPQRPGEASLPPEEGAESAAPQEPADKPDTREESEKDDRRLEELDVADEDDSTPRQTSQTPHPPGDPESEEAKAKERSSSLPDDVRRAIAEHRRRYPTAQAALLPALHTAQDAHGGWLPDAAVEAVAAELELDPAQVYGVVTFYDLYHQKPVGRHRIRVCTNVSCMLRGSDAILSTLAEALGVGENEVTPDGAFSYTHFECLGSCDTAPMMMVGRDYHENLTPERVREVVERLRDEPHRGLLEGGFLEGGLTAGTSPSGPPAKEPR